MLLCASDLVSRLWKLLLFQEKQKIQYRQIIVYVNWRFTNRKFKFEISHWSFIVFCWTLLRKYHLEHIIWYLGHENKFDDKIKFDDIDVILIVKSAIDFNKQI